MKFPLSWLKEYINTSLSPEKIAENLTLIGLEVESLTPTASTFSGVVVGEVLEIAPHPDAQKLIVAKVSDGKEIFQVVCGASNCRAGLKTAFAKVGAVLTGEKGAPFTIKKAKLRGIESSGMLCAHDELGMSKTPFGTEGIMELPSSFKVGEDLHTLFSDVIFEVAVTPNLSHCLSLIGIARELAAITLEPVTTPHTAVSESGSSKIQDLVKVSVESPTLCPRYCCKMLLDVKVGPSPDWLKLRLEQSGLRSVNNVVDITNYVLWELGMPLHAFDYATLQGQQIVVRPARPGESIVTLDGKEHFPSTQTLLICDANSPVAIAGVMGSLATEVTEKTTQILLECAYFEPTQVRRTCKRMGIHSEAARRFERGVDPNRCVAALERACSLLQKYANASVPHGTIDTHPQEFPSLRISCRTSRLNRILGTQLAQGEVETLLSRLGLKILSSKQDDIEVEVPTYRHDLKQEIDLIEEVARLYGFDNIHQKNVQPVYRGSTLAPTPLYSFEKEIRNRLLNEGLQEFLTCNLISPQQAEWILPDGMPSRSLIKLLNPSSVDQSVMRPSLLPNMLQVAKFNTDHEVESVAGFEIGKIHFKSKDDFIEPTVASLILMGKKSPTHWSQKGEEVDFFDLKGIVENLLQGLSLEHIEFLPSQFNNFHPGRQARILVSKRDVGIIGEIHPRTLQKVGLAKPLLFAELNLEDLLFSPKKEGKMDALSPYPGSSRDWTFTLAKNCPIAEVFQLIEKERSALLESHLLVSVYEDERIGQIWKNVTFRFVYRDKNQTISLESVRIEHERMTQSILKKLQEEKKVQ